jgi:hypothetical protein
MFRGARFNRIVFRWLAPAVGVAGLGLALFFYFHTPAPKSYRLRATTGNELGMRHQLAVRLKKEAADRNLVLDLTPCSGSEEALDWVNTRRVDVALVQGALSAIPDLVPAVGDRHASGPPALTHDELTAPIHPHDRGAE